MMKAQKSQQSKNKIPSKKLLALELKMVSISTPWNTVCVTSPWATKETRIPDLPLNISGGGVGWSLETRGDSSLL